MASLIIPSSGTNWFQGTASINWRNPITQGLMSLVYPGAGAYDLVSGRPLQQGINGLKEINGEICIASTPSSGSSGDQWIVWLPRKVYSGMSLLLRQRTFSRSAYGEFLSIPGDETNIDMSNPNIGNSIDSTGINISISSNVLGGNTAVFRNTSDVQVGRKLTDDTKFVNTMFTWNPEVNSGLGYFFCNNESIPNSAGVGQTVVSDWNLSSSNSVMAFGAGGVDFIEYFASFFAFWDRQLSRTEVMDVNDNPMQLITPTRRHVRVYPSVPVLSNPTANVVTTTSMEPKVTIKW